MCSEAQRKHGLATALGTRGQVPYEGPWVFVFQIGPIRITVEPQLDQCATGATIAHHIGPDKSIPGLLSKPLYSRQRGVVEWCTSLLAPSPTLKDSGKWERWETLASTLTPLLKNHVGRIFLKWSHANSTCIVGKLKECVVDLPCGTWRNVVGGPQKYQHKSLQVLRSKYAKVRNVKLDKLMAETNCLDVLVHHVSGEESESERRRSKL